MLPPGSGTGIFIHNSPKVIRLLLQGCTNRPFYHIVVTVTRTHQSRPVIEQLGSYDPLPNEHDEKLVALNFERIRYWIGNGAAITTPVAQLLGLAGFYPIHPSSYMQAWRNRRTLAEKTPKAADETQEKLEETAS